MTELEVIEVGHGIANNFGTHIEINKHLKDYPKLYAKIVGHERQHTDKMYSFQDFKIDLLASSDIKNMDLLWFIRHHPAAMIQFFPIWYSRRNGIYYDINMLIAYAVFTIPILAALFIGIKFL
jgi:hypothetical protein